MKIFPRTLKQRSPSQGMSSETSSKERQSLQIQSTSGHLEMIARARACCTLFVLVHLTFLHHEVHFLENAHILQRVVFDGHDVGEFPGLDGSYLR